MYEQRVELPSTVKKRLKELIPYFSVAEMGQKYNITGKSLLGIINDDDWLSVTPEQMGALLKILEEAERKKSEVMMYVATRF